MDLLAKKLAAGLVSAPAMLSWWPRHSRMAIRYTCIGHETQNTVQSIRQSMSMNCLEWEGAIPAVARRGLMCHHAGIEMGLADAARENNVDKIERYASLLIENAEEMAASFGRSIVEFPETQFLRLLAEHVVSFAELVRLKAEKSSKRSGERMERNTLALAAFTTEWF